MSTKIQQKFSAAVFSWVSKQLSANRLNNSYDFTVMKKILGARVGYEVVRSVEDTVHRAFN